MVELRTQMPLGISISRRPSGDAKKFKPVAKKVIKLGKSVKLVILDKGYDDEKVHEFIREVMEALSIIPARKCAYMENFWKIQKADENGLQQEEVPPKKRE